MAQQVKDLVLSLLWLGLLLRCGFDLWPGNFHVLQVPPKTNKQTNKQKTALFCPSTWGAGVGQRHGAGGGGDDVEL